MKNENAKWHTQAERSALTAEAKKNAPRNEEGRIIADGVNYIEYKNGSIAYKPTGQIIFSTYRITKETAPAVLARRREVSLQAVEKGILEGTQTKTLGRGLQKIAAAQTRLALRDNVGRASTEAARFLWHALGADDEGNIDQGSATIKLDAGAVERIFIALSSERERRGRDCGAIDVVGRDVE